MCILDDLAEENIARGDRDVCGGEVVLTKKKTSALMIKKVYCTDQY